jgi:hypothetical protein
MRKQKIFNRLFIRIACIFFAAILFQACAGSSDSPISSQPSVPQSSETTTTQPNQPGEPPAADPSLATLHLIIVADTLDNKIGQSVAVDSKNFQDFFQSVVNSSQGKIFLNKVVLEGRDITRNNLFATLNFVSPRIKSNDIVVFLYSGHGYRMQTKVSKWPVLNTREYATEFDDVITILKNSNPRQIIAIADCCNSFIDRGIRTAKILKAPEAFSYQDIERMFLLPKTKIAASGSKVGQFSNGDDVDGGFFSAAFISNLRKSLLSSDGNWDKVFTGAVSVVSQRTQNEQVPQYEEIR